MKRFKNILAVYSDQAGADDVLNQASALAERNAAQLTLIEVIEEEMFSDSRFDDRQKQLSCAAASIGQRPAEAEAKVLVGKPFLQITRQVLRGGHDLVVMAAEAGGGFTDLFFGSTSMHLMRKCPCPVWILKPGQTCHFSRILAAVDTKPEAAKVDDLNVMIMDLATSLARMNRSELHIAHAWELTGRDLDTIRSEITDEIRDRLLSRNELRHKKALESLLESYSLDELDHHVHVMRGSPDFVLPKLAEEMEVDLIVMGTIGRTGIAGLLIGDTAEFILRQVHCSVLAVKPAGFETPVTLED